MVAKLSQQNTELWRIPVTGGPGEKLHFFPEEYYFDFVMHLNGKQLAFTQYRVNAELWVLENFLPK